MEELFQYMKTLRSQINDVEDQAEKMSVEEHMQGATIRTLQKDLDLGLNFETQRIKEEIIKMLEAKGQMCVQILEKQRKYTSLDSDSVTLSQTLELVQQEKLSLSAKLVDQSSYYKKVHEDINGQLKEQQVNEKATKWKGFQSNASDSMTVNIQAAQTNLDKIEQLKSDLVGENAKLRQQVEVAKNKMTGIKAELCDVDDQSLEAELQALIHDKAGEFEYVQSLETQILRLKEISQKVRCSCGKEYNVQQLGS